MREAIVSIDKAGRVVIPKRIRDELALRAGDKLRISVSAQKVRLSPEKVTPGFIRKGQARVFSSRESQILTPEMVNNLIAEDRQERENLFGRVKAKNK